MRRRHNHRHHDGRGPIAWSMLMQRGAPVPTPEEEYWNATANGKLHMMGGNQGGKNDRVLEYDIAADKWTTKKPAGHTAFNGNGAEALHSNVNEVFELTAAK